MEEENLNNVQNFDDLEITKEELRAFYSMDEEKLVSEEEVKGLAVDIIELEEMHGELVNKQEELISNLEYLEERLNALKVVEEEE